jgi:NADPH:quinone reductase-like Zn-dependent oxidoreductase
MPPCDPYREADVAAEVARLTDRAGVHVAYDAVGKDTFDGSLAALSSRGHLVNYGQASGPIPPLDIARLGAKSATLSRPFLFAYISTRPELEAQAGAFFAAAPDLPLGIGGRFPLAQAGAAQAALENRERAGLLRARPRAAEVWLSMLEASWRTADAVVI